LRIVENQFWSWWTGELLQTLNLDFSACRKNRKRKKEQENMGILREVIEGKRVSKTSYQNWRTHRKDETLSSPDQLRTQK